MGSWEQNPFLQPHLPGVVSEPLVLAGVQGPVEKEPQGKPWEEAIQSPAEGCGLPPAGPYSIGIPGPLLSLLLLGKASHLPLSQSGRVVMTTAWVQMPTSLPVHLGRNNKK